MSNKKMHHKTYHGFENMLVDIHERYCWRYLFRICVSRFLFCRNIDRTDANCPGIVQTSVWFLPPKKKKEAEKRKPKIMLRVFTPRGYI